MTYTIIIPSPFPYVEIPCEKKLHFQKGNNTIIYQVYIYFIEIIVFFGFFFFPFLHRFGFFSVAFGRGQVGVLFLSFFSPAFVGVWGCHFLLSSQYRSGHLRLTNWFLCFVMTFILIKISVTFQRSFIALKKKYNPCNFLWYHFIKKKNSHAISF